MTSCPDCPHYNPERMPSGWTPRAKCCVDQMPGHQAMFDRIEAAKAAAALLPTRQQRRAAERAARKGGYRG
jgi:hypothetical protein